MVVKRFQSVVNREKLDNRRFGVLSIDLNAVIVVYKEEYILVDNHLFFWTVT